MEYSIYSPMKICGHVRDKCCTLIDEMIISKSWVHRTEPLIAAYHDQTILYTRKIMEMFNRIAKIDPREMSVKYMRKLTVPYVHEFCYARTVPFK